MSEPSSKSKSQLRAERRALQEAQRASKQASKGQNVSQVAGKSSPANPPKQKESELGNTVGNVTQSPIVVQSSSNPSTNTDEIVHHNPSAMKLPSSFPCIPTRKQESNRVHLFKHLKEPDRRTDVVQNMGLGSCSPIHPTFIAFGVNLDEGCVWESNETALHFLSACETLIRAHQPASVHGQQHCSFARRFEPILQRHVYFLANCRSPMVTMHSAYQYIKQMLNQIDSLEDWANSRSRLLTSVAEFRQQSIYLAGAEIAERASPYIKPGDCICTFGYSSVVACVLLRAWFGVAQRPKCTTNDSDTARNTIRPPRTDTAPAVCFSVLVVDSSPKFHGRRMLSHLVQAGIPCEYTHIAALPGLAHKISLTIVGADALLNNGYVLAGVGTAQVCNIVWTVARSPILVCAETYKFWERAHSDAFEFNELGDPDDIWRGPRSPDAVGTAPPGSSVGLLPMKLETDLSDWRSNPRLRLLQLVYDVLPPALVSAVITEKGTLPTTSVPVVLRVKQASVPL